MNVCLYIMLDIYDKYVDIAMLYSVIIQLH